MFSYFLKGLAMSAGLIMAIGAQNAHVLRAGLRRQHVVLTVLACIVCEALLIMSGVTGIGGLIQQYPWLLILAKWGGAACMIFYGVRAWRAVFHAQAMDVSQIPALPARSQALGSVLAVTLLNPHVYLDTVILLGAIASQQPGDGPYWFAAGAITNALLWFSCLGFAAHLLAPAFARPRAWQYLEAVTGSVMLLMALNLLTE